MNLYSYTFDIKALKLCSLSRISNISASIYTHLLTLILTLGFGVRWAKVQFLFFVFLFPPTRTRFLIFGFIGGVWSHILIAFFHLPVALVLLLHLLLLLLLIRGRKIHKALRRWRFEAIGRNFAFVLSWIILLGLWLFSVLLPEWLSKVILTEKPPRYIPIENRIWELSFLLMRSCQGIMRSLFNFIPWW